MKNSLKLKFAGSAVSLIGACSGTTKPQAINPFQQAIGRQLPPQGLAVELKDPISPVMEKKGN
jgi:hypothetical protein